MSVPAHRCFQYLHIFRPYWPYIMWYSTDRDSELNTVHGIYWTFSFLCLLYFTHAFLYNTCNTFAVNLLWWFFKSSAALYIIYNLISSLLLLCHTSLKNFCLSKFIIFYIILGLQASDNLVCSLGLFPITLTICQYMSIIKWRWQTVLRLFYDKVEKVL